MTTSKREDKCCEKCCEKCVSGYGCLGTSDKNGDCTSCPCHAPKEQEIGWREELYKAPFYKELPPSSQASLQGFIEILISSHTQQMIERVENLYEEDKPGEFGHGYNFGIQEVLSLLKEELRK